MKKKKDVLFHQDNAPCHKSIATIAKLHELHFELLPQPPYSPDLVPQQLLVVCRPQNNALGKEEVISETDAHFEAKDKSFNKKGIKLFEKRWNQRITLEGDYVDE